MTRLSSPWTLVIKTMTLLSSPTVIDSSRRCSTLGNNIRETSRIDTTSKLTLSIEFGIWWTKNPKKSKNELFPSGRRSWASTSIWDWNSWRESRRSMMNKGIRFSRNGKTTRQSWNTAAESRSSTSIWPKSYLCPSASTKCVQPSKMKNVWDLECWGTFTKDGKTQWNIIVISCSRIWLPFSLVNQMSECLSKTSLMPSKIALKRENSLYWTMLSTKIWTWLLQNMPNSTKTSKQNLKWKTKRELVISR